jgi:hypothetical protein
VLFALAYSPELGSGNQHTYLLDPLVRAHPELFHQDWFVTENHHYHFGFAWLTAPLFSLDPDGATALAILQILVTIGTLGAIYGLAAAITSRGRAALFVGITGLIMLGSDRTLGGGYLYSTYLQPSSLAVVGWLVAINFWIRNRTLYAGIALGIGAVFHVNYALLGIGVFGFAELLMARPRSLKRLAMLLAPSLIVVVAFLPRMLASSKTDHEALAMRVLVQFLFPGHFKPSMLWKEIASLLGWFVLLLALRPKERDGAIARLFTIATVIMAASIAAVAIVSIPPLLSFTRLFVWRIGPFGVVCAQLLLVFEVSRMATGERPLPRGRSLIAIIVAAGAISYNAFIRRRAPAYAEIVTCVFVVFALAALLRRERIVTVACAALCAAALWWGRAGLETRPLFERYDSKLTQWARASSPRDALFLVPPYQSRFRFPAQRAVVVDVKSPPMYLDEIVAWYHRLCDVVDARDVASLPALAARWDALSADQLVAIAQKFHADYVVLDKNRNRARLSFAVVYEDDANIVYEVPLR